MDVQETKCFFARLTETEIIFLDTGLRLDGLLALELWDLIVSVIGSVSQISDRSGRLVNDVKRRQESQEKVNVLNNIEYTQTSRPRVKKLYCMFLKTMKEGST